MLWIKPQLRKKSKITTEEPTKPYRLKKKYANMYNTYIQRESSMRGDSHAEFGKRQLRENLVVDFH